MREDYQTPVIPVALAFGAGGKVKAHILIKEATRYVVYFSLAALAAIILYYGIKIFQEVWYPSAPAARPRVGGPLGYAFEEGSGGRFVTSAMTLISYIFYLVGAAKTATGLTSYWAKLPDKLSLLMGMTFLLSALTITYVVNFLSCGC